MRAENAATYQSYRRPVVIAGAGLSGMVLALDMARRGQRVTLIERTNGSLKGSRAITYSPTTLEILCALGCGDRPLEAAIRWFTGTEFLAGRKLRSVAHAPASAAERFTGYHSLPQPIVHDSLMAKIKTSPLVELWLECELKYVAQEADGTVRVRAERSGADVEFLCDYLVAADGAHSQVRRQLGLHLKGDRVAETFLICDLETPQNLASDRTVWFDPPFAGGKVALLLKYGDRQFRFDVHMPGLQRQELDGSVVRNVIREAFGAEFEYRLDFWTTYQFACQMLDGFQHGSVFFIGDAAHLVPPFGARGGNGGVADAFNLSWKLAGVIQGTYAKELLLTYGSEMQEAARLNLEETGKTMRFLVPQTPLDRSIRNAALQLCGTDSLAQRIVNSGSMSRPCHYGAETQLHLAEWDGSRYVLPAIKKLPNFLIRAAGHTVFLHDRLGEDFSLVVVSPTADSGLDQKRRLAAEFAEFATVLAILVVVEDKPSATASSSVVWDEQGLLQQLLAGRDEAILLVRPDRYQLAIMDFHQVDRLKALVRAIVRPGRPELLTETEQRHGSHDDDREYTGNSRELARFEPEYWT